MPKLRRIIRTAMAIIGGVIVAATVAYEVVLPEYYANAYVNKVQSVAKSVSPTFAELAKTTERDILYDSTVSDIVRLGDVTATRRSVATVQSNVDKLEQVSEALPVIAYSGYTPSYRNALMLQDRMRAFVDQSRVTLSEYTELVDSVDAYDALIADAKRDIETFNQVTDINVYAGRSAEVRLIETKLKGAADTITSSKSPEEFRALQQSAGDAILRASVGFGDLAYGLDIAVDAVIYRAAADIERAGNDLDQIDLNEANQVNKSRILKDIRDLGERIGLFM